MNLTQTGDSGVQATRTDGGGMRATLVVLQWLIRVIGTVMVVLGVLFWTGNAYSLINVHMLLGLTLVLLVWVVAGLAGRAGVSPAFVGLALAWGLAVPVLGLNQTSLLPGALHWLIQVLHLLLGIGAIALAETLSRHAQARLTPAYR
jgi:hypothetical protein